MFDKQINTLYLDLDGVLADFDQYLVDHAGFHYSDSAEPWEFVLTVDRFYYVLEPTKYFTELWNQANAVATNVEILTAIPRRTTIASAEQDKRDWCAKYLGLSVKVNIGPYSKDKWRWCKPGDVLVDDREDNISSWIQAGGVGILHKYDDVNPTLEALKNL